MKLAPAELYDSMGFAIIGAVVAAVVAVLFAAAGIALLAKGNTGDVPRSALVVVSVVAFLCAFSSATVAWALSRSSRDRGN